MTLVKYETLLNVARTKSMSKTAQQMHQTVPGVSYTITKLEEEWGIPLFVRNRGKLSLTEDGAQILPYVEEVLNAQGCLLHKIESLKGAEHGKVRVGGIRSITKQWIPRIIKYVKKKYPNMEIEVVFESYQDIQKDLQNNVIDLAFSGEVALKQFDFHFIMDDPYMVLLPKNHPLAKKTLITINDIQYEKIIASDWKADNDMTRFIDEFHLNHQVVYRIEDAGTIISMVENGIGLSVLPKFICMAETADVCMVPFADLPAKKFGIMTMESSMLTSTVKNFIKCVEEWINEEILK